MMSRRVVTVIVAVMVLAGAYCVATGEMRGRDLPQQSSAQFLARQFPDARVSFFLLDLRSGETLSSRWEGQGGAVPVGSLVKPFTALAYAQSHQFRFPEHVCEAGTCWLPRGHGRLRISQAIAHSCNSYFVALAADVNPEQVTTLARQFGLHGPGLTATADELAGKFGAWRESPLALAHAYAELLLRRSQPGVRDIVAGMALSAKEGTGAGIGAALGLRVLAKTGTAPCTHKHRAPGDGFAIVAWPADIPRYVLLVREHGVPGSEAAKVAGQMVRALEAQP